MPKGQKTKASAWLALIEEWRISGLNKKEYCLNKAIDYKNFTKWYSRLVSPRKIIQATDTATPLSNAGSLFVPIEIKSAEKVKLSAKPLILILNNKLQLQIPVESIDGPLLAMLFKSLGVVSC